MVHQNTLPITLVTGASEGIGEAIAWEFARKSHHLLLVARNENKLLKLQKSISNKYPVQVFVLSLDLLDLKLAEKLLLSLEENQLHVEILINNAGTGLAGPFIDRDKDKCLKLMELNMQRLTLLSHIFLPDMLKRQIGGIINISSLGGFVPGPYQAVYYASKAYVNSFTRALAAENLFSGVKFCAVCPGPVETGFHQKMGIEGAYYPEAVGCMSAKSVAWYTYWGYKSGLKVVIPGVRNMFYALGLKVIPHSLMIPFLGIILKQRLKADKKE